MEYHEAANLFPLDEENIPSLAEDIRANGQQVDIKVMDNLILDGRRRQKACEIAGVEPRYCEVSVKDPVAYAVSLNLKHRHLTVSQQAMVGERVKEMYSRQAKERQKKHGGTAPGKKSLQETLPEVSKGQARDKAGAAVGVSGKLIDAASKVRKKGVPELVKAVEEGRMSVTRAAKLAEEADADEQREEAEAAIFSNGRFRSTRKKDPKQTRTVKVYGVSGLKGVGIIHADEAITALSRIPQNDALRKDGFKRVRDWMKHNP